MMQAYAIWGVNCQNWITYKGKVLVHDNRRELEFLYPLSIVRSIQLREDEAMSIKDHPQNVADGLQWPLRESDFW